MVKQQPQDPKVFITSDDATCSECGEKLGRNAWITLVENKGPLCLTCADLDRLLFLPSGDPALTRRARKHSKLAAVVLRWRRARQRYERQDARSLIASEVNQVLARWSEGK
jgi:hypothetical protein